MNSVVVTLCVLFALAVLPAPIVRGVLATAAASMFEATPFILAGMGTAAVVERFFPRVPAFSTLDAYLGCGCTDGPSARSLPAAAAMALTFGPFVAASRLAAAAIASRCLSGHPERSAQACHPERSAQACHPERSAQACHPERSAQACHPERSAAGAKSRDHHRATLCGQLRSLLPAAILGGIALHVLRAFDTHALAPMLQLLAGALLGILASPCALGTVAFASSLHARAPLAAFGLLCTSGIVDVRAFVHAHDTAPAHDPGAYAVAAGALAIVAARGGDTLVHPRFVAALACAAVACCVLAVVHRRERSPRALLASATMLAGALISAPPPIFTATESTMTSLFAGERLTFVGQVIHGRDADALVRFAITCCRADASPVVVRLARRVSLPAGSWTRVQGIAIRAGNQMVLEQGSASRIAPPADPFIYR